MDRRKKKLVAYWLRCAQEDTNVMRYNFERKRYAYALYFGHLVAEKTLKGYYVKTVDNCTPYSRDLVYLAKRCRLHLTEEQIRLLRTLTRFIIDTDFPNIRIKHQDLCTREFTYKHLLKLRSFIGWLVEKI